MTSVKIFLNKLNNMSPAAKASFWFVVSNVVLKGISFITTPIFTRLLNAEDYGVTSVFVTWETIIAIFATLCLSGGVYNVAMTRFDKDISAYTSSMIGLTALCSTTVYTLGIIINIILPSLFRISNVFLVYMWLQTFTNAITTFWLMRQRFIYSYKKVIAYTFANSFLNPVIAIVCIKFLPFNKAYAKILGSGIFGIIFGIILTILLIQKGKSLYNRTYWSHALKFNIPLIPHFLASGVLSSTDKIMLNNFIGAYATGLYSVANSIVGIISIITQSINSSLIPYTMQSIKKGNIKTLYKTILGCSVLIAVICELIILFAREGIMIFATNEYINSVWYVSPLAFAVLVSFISGIIGNIIYYYEKTKYMSLATIISAISNVVLNYVGLKIWGMVAVGYATLITNFITLICYYIIAKKFEKNLDKIIDLKLLIVIFISFAILMVYGIIFWDNLPMKIALLVAIFIIMLCYKQKIINLINTIIKKDKEND